MTEELLRKLIVEVQNIRDDASVFRARVNMLDRTAEAIEAIIDQAARELGVDPYEVKEF